MTGEIHMMCKGDDNRPPTSRSLRSVVEDPITTTKCVMSINIFLVQHFQIL